MKPIFLIFSLFLLLHVFSQRTQEEALKLCDSLYMVADDDNIDLFCELILQFSDDLASKENCGEYGFELASKFVPEIGNYVLENHETSEISSPIKSAFGYHLVQPIAVRGEEIKFRHLLIGFSNP
ncbi:MAG: peptidylprolyl isomerase [Crocinitomicaceae bacterium]|nr:peptidylprolyl isomerase [Crocinitomicaceae bacterium]